MIMTDVMGRERYRLDRPLGIGAMGAVHLARDTVLDRVVAVKVLAEHLATDELFRHRFVREARLAARLCHPNIVAVFDAGDDDGRPFLVMEYVEGETVAARLARGQAFSGDELVTLLTELSAGLAYAHAQGIVHRDVKPHNVLVRHDGVAKLTDFGIARAIADEGGLTEVGTVLGTAAYMAPEQAAGGEVGSAADVYSLAALARAAAAGPLPAAVERLITAALDPDPAARPTAEELHRSLAGADAGEGEGDGRTADAAPTEVRAVAATEVFLPTAAVAAVELFDDDEDVRPAPERSPRLVTAFIAAFVFVVLVAVALRSGTGPDSGAGPPDRAAATAATSAATAATGSPVPAPADPTRTARDFATWLRSRSD